MALSSSLNEVKKDAERLALKRIRDWKDENPEQAQSLEDSLAETLELTKAREDGDKTSIEDEATASKPSQPVSESKVEEKPLEKQNKAELLATAEAKGVTVEDGATNKQIVEAIKSKEGTE